MKHFTFHRDTVSRVSVLRHKTTGLIPLLFTMFTLFFAFTATTQAQSVVVFDENFNTAPSGWTFTELIKDINGDISQNARKKRQSFAISGINAFAGVRNVRAATAQRIANHVGNAGLYRAGRFAG